MPKQDVAFELYYDGAWHDLVPDDDVLIEQLLKIKRGFGDESAAFRPASIEARLANDDDMYRTSNPESPLYGKAGLNTPTRVAVGDVVRGTVEASSWNASQTRDFRRTPRRGKAWVDFDGGGVSQRIGQWTEKLKSPFRQYNDTIDSSVVIGYWSLEQARGSTSLLSATPGTKQIVMQNVAFDSQFRPPGSAPLMDIGDDPAEAGAYFARDAAIPDTDGWQLSWGARLAPLVAGEQDIFDWETADGTAYGLYLDSTLKEIKIYSALAGAPVINGLGGSYGSYDWSQWTLFSLDARYVAGNTNIYINWTNGDNTESGFIAIGFPGVPSTPVWWDASTFAGVPAGSTIGHVIATKVDSTGEDLFSAARIAAWTGHVRETTAARLGRLCTLKGISYTIVGTAADSYLMGPQQVDTFVAQLLEIQTTEDGLIFDDIDDTALVFMLRNARLNQTPACTFQLTDLPFPPDEVTDDLQPHNIITAAQPDGSEYTVRDDTGPLGTQPPPDGRGEYEQRRDVNVADGTSLPQVANWWLRRGTVNLPRFPQVVVNLAALDPAKIAEVESVDIGSVITIDGYREYTIRLHVLGYTETIGTHSRQIVFTCEPDQQFRTGVYDGDSGYTPRYDLRTCTLSTAYGPTATTLVFSFTQNEKWSQTQAFDLMIAGELIGVPAGGMGAQSGSGPYAQTLTGAVRSKNGIRKTLPAGSQVHIATPGRWA